MNRTDPGHPWSWGGRMVTLIGAAWRRLRRFFSGGDTAVPEPALPEAPAAGPGAGEPVVQGLSSILGPVVAMPGPEGPGVGTITSSGDMEGWNSPGASASEPDDSSGPGMDLRDPGELAVGTITTSSSGMEGESSPDKSAQGEMLSPHEDPDPLPTDPAETEDPGIDLGRWTVTLHAESPFEKVGRLTLAGTDLVIRSDLDRRGFYIALADVAHVLEGDPAPVRLISDGSVIGSAKRSASGKAMNFSIPPFLYTTPLRSLCPVLDEQARKAPLFVGREVVEPARNSG